jgi:hypothetical protein
MSLENYQVKQQGEEMRANKEFESWIESEKFVSAEGGLEEAYTTGFNRAIELVEEFLKDKQSE